MAEPRFSDKCKVTISEDNMSAKLIIDIPSDGIAYSVEELASFLKTKGVYCGVIFSNLEDMTQNNIYLKDVEVAKGTYPVEGTSGYYEYFFSSEKKKPLIRSDGSVDYQSMSMLDNVSRGDKLAKYYKAVPGTHGMDVRGRQLRCQPCKDLPPLKGTGFDYDDDTGEYVAAHDGRIDFKNGTLNIRDVYEHKGNVDYLVGKLDFRGDIIIHGNVLSGTYIRASKSITIDGSVEAATLIAEGDIVLKKGIAGDKKAKIISGGSVFANFIEFAQVEAKENIEANIIMNSKLSAGKSIVISGKRGAIVGGSSYAVGDITSTLLGNIAGHKTMVVVGETQELLDRGHFLSLKLESAKDSLRKTNDEIRRVTDVRLLNERKEVKQAKLSQLNRRKLRDERMIEHIHEELDSINATIALARNGRITVSNTIYSGSTVVVDTLTYDVNSDMPGAVFTHDRDNECIKKDPIV